jgi:polyhydroxyalkanoate synthesis regulator phasin
MNQYTPTLSQYKATAAFHRRMEKAFKSVGKTTDAESARKAAEALEAKIREIENETPTA